MPKIGEFSSSEGSAFKNRVATSFRNQDTPGSEWTRLCQNCLSETVGISQALTWLGSQPAGNVLLGVVAIGTLCYGVWCAVQARYRRIRIEDAA